MFKRVLGVIFICMSLLVAGCSSSNEKLLLGGWYSETETTIPKDKDGISGELKVKGIDNYLANKASSFDGQVIFVFNYPQGQNPFTKLEVVYDANITSDWELKDKSIFTKIVDLKIHPNSVKIDDKLIDDDDQKKVFFAELEKSFKPEDFIPKGTADEERVISIDAKTMVSDSKDESGKWIRKTATKTDKSFSEYLK